MNSLGKVLVVFVTASSLAFAAFAMSLVSGGPNWKSESESPELTNDFVFTMTPGDKPTYTVKNRRTDASVQAATPLLAEAVVAARKRQLEDATKLKGELEQKIAQIKPIIDQIKALIPPDQAGVTARTEAYEKQLEQLNAAIQVASTEITTKSGEIQQTRKMGEERRDEAFRLKNQLELLRNDLFAAKDQQKVLEDELVRAEENLKRLDRRAVQLKQQVGGYDDGGLETKAGSQVK
jgi:DNA repair exonuclease SbcCD ATPase subunit